MRRSAAPSFRASKKMKFCTPFLGGNKADTAGKSHDSAKISFPTASYEITLKQADPNKVS